MLAAESLSTHSLARTRMERTIAASLTIDDALEALRNVNPATEPRGTRPIGVGVVQWEAVAAEPLRINRNLLGMRGQFRVGLYHLKLRILDPNGLTLADADLDTPGWRSVGDGDS
jgi:hypothetical protein